MKSALLTCLGLAAILLVHPHPLEAHHGWAEFDLNQEITLDGTVTDFHFVNPHCVVEFNAKDAKGRMRKWQGEFASPAQLTKKGWNAASLQPGDMLTLSGYAAKNDVPAIHVLRIRLSNGEEVKVDSAR